MPEYTLQLSSAADERGEFGVDGHPARVVRYSVALRSLDEGGRAIAVRVFDNSNSPGEHHMAVGALVWVVARPRS